MRVGAAADATESVKASANDTANAAAQLTSTESALFLNPVGAI